MSVQDRTSGRGSSSCSLKCCIVVQMHEGIREEYESRVDEAEQRLTKAKRHIKELETRSADKLFPLKY